MASSPVRNPAKTAADLPEGMYITAFLNGHDIVAEIRPTERAKELSASGLWRPRMTDRAAVAASLSPSYGNHYIIERAEAPHGWGPLLYDVVMELAGTHGLMADRSIVSEDALEVWKKYFVRPDIRKVYGFGSARSAMGDDPDRVLGHVYFATGTPTLDALKAAGKLQLADFRDKTTKEQWAYVRSPEGRAGLAPRVAPVRNPYRWRAARDRTKTEEPMGWTPNHADVNYMGAVVWTSPRTFLNLCNALPPEDRRGRTIDHAQRMWDESGDVALPQLYLRRVDGAPYGEPYWRVVGHEGRHRTTVAEKNGAQVVPVYVLLEPEDGERYKGTRLTPELIESLRDFVRGEAHATETWTRLRFDQFWVRGKLYRRGQEPQTIDLESVLIDSARSEA